MSDIKELRDEELEKVNGGGSGTIPECGITFMSYAVPSNGHYYSHEQNTNTIAYVYENSDEKLFYVKENFVCEGNNWWAISTSSSKATPMENVAGFMAYYPYVLNIQPN